MPLNIMVEPASIISTAAIADEVSFRPHPYLQPAANPRTFPTLYQQFSLQIFPKTLQGFFRLFDEDNDDDSDDDSNDDQVERLIWITPDTFIVQVDEDLEANFVFPISVSSPRDSNQNVCHGFTIYSESNSGALWTLKCLFETSGDDFYTSLCISSLCEDTTFLGKNFLEALISQNPERTNTFSGFEFNCSDIRVLTTTGNANNLTFCSCTFLEDDHGSSPYECGSPRNTSSGPSKLCFIESFPKELMVSWNLGSILQLSFLHVNFDINQCRALTSLDIRELMLNHCVCEDGGASIEFAIRAGKGPRGFRLISGPVFDSAERCLSVINALQDNTRIESFELNGSVCVGLDCMQALAAALRRNKGLKRLGYVGVKGGDCWKDLFDAVANHTALCTFSLTSAWARRAQRGDLSAALLAMALKNDNLESVIVNECSLVDQKIFSKLVEPKLQCNLYRKRFIKIQNVDVESTRAGIVASVLARLQNKPSLVFMLLSQNIDSIVVEDKPEVTPEFLALATKKHFRTYRQCQRKSRRIAEKLP